MMNDKLRGFKEELEEMEYDGKQKTKGYIKKLNQIINELLKLSLEVNNINDEYILFDIKKEIDIYIYKQFKTNRSRLVNKYK